MTKWAMKKKGSATVFTHPDVEGPVVFYGRLSATTSDVTWGGKDFPTVAAAKAAALAPPTPVEPAGDVLREAEMAIMEIRRTVSEGSQWRHVRSGLVYIVVCVAVNENSMKPAVVYKRMAGVGPIWTRPAKEFLDGRFACLD